MNRLRPALGALMIVASLAGSGCSTTVDAGGGGPEVVAAFYPIAAAARLVGGNEATVHDLTPAGAEPHDLELKPSDFALLRSADLILYLGGGFQPALEDAIAALSDRSNALDLLDGLPLITGTGDAPTDPHVWLDPVLMGRIVSRIEVRLGERRPSQREAFIENAGRYVAGLNALDEEYARTLATCERRELVTSHASFGYLAARYGLEQIAISISPDVEPPPRRLENVARAVRERGATTIFFEPLVGPRIAASIARATGATTAVLNPIEGLTADDERAGESYLSLMKENLAALAGGLGCAQS